VVAGYYGLAGSGAEVGAAGGEIELGNLSDSDSEASSYVGQGMYDEFGVPRLQGGGGVLSWERL